MPILTVCITTFNRWYTCKNALLSVCNQTLKNIEVILVDDYSSDQMPEEIERYISEHHIVYIRHECNKGLAAARNTAIENASGKYFAFCDDDDKWPAKLAEGLVQAIQNGPIEVGMSVAVAVSWRLQCHELFDGHPKLTELILQGFTPPVSSQLYRTELLRTIGGYNIDVKSGVDHDLWISLAAMDHRVAVSWGEPAIVGNNPHAERMTTVEEKRRYKIYEALQIWQPQIIDVFGEDFYKHFCNSYERYLNFKFFVNSVKKRAFVLAARKLFEKYVLTQVAEKIIHKVTGRRRYNLFPAYKSHMRKSS